MAVFPRAREALSAAIDAQLVLNAEAWEKLCRIRARMALHTGTAEERDGDYFGPALNRVARLLGTGHGGQVLASTVTQELVRDDLPEGVELRDLGEHRLRHLTRPERVFQIAATDLPTQFPPLRTLDNRPNNLPLQPTPFLGREQEIEVVGRLLREDFTRLVTLTGPGGTGKTRLALQTAAEVLDKFDDGVFFVSLAALTDPSLVASTIAHDLGLVESGGEPILEVLKEWVNDKRLLLVIDNFEQVADAAPVVTELLADCPRLKVMVTSRAPLRLRGEHEYPVAPLSTPDPKHLPDLQTLTQYDAVRLFIERAREVRPDFEVTNETAPAVAEICHRLDGLPLALELAAVRTKLFQPQALLQRLSNRLKLLTGGARDLSGRQQTLRAAIDWSYDLLSEEEKLLLARLSVFAGGSRFEAVEEVCDADGTLDILDGVQSLVDKSLVRQSEGVGGETRFVMLETIREYAGEKLEAMGEADKLRERHAEYLLRLAEEAEPHLRGSQQMLWLDRLDEEHDNVRVALACCLEQRKTEQGLRLATALARFWDTRGYYSEGRRWLEAFLASSGADESSPALQARALLGAAWLAHDQDDFLQADALFEESLRLGRARGEPGPVAAVLAHRAVMARGQGQYAKATELVEESLRVARGADNLADVAYALFRLGLVVREQGDYSRAAAAYQECLQAYRTLGDAGGAAFALLGLGDIARDQGDPDSVEGYCVESLA
ncbi:MAG: tetratricopeptide repeat protein, partial [Chloroflexota bacterium]|nr:tetratricopeptide repeat protein [Chloroflexota bacterium]